MTRSSASRSERSTSTRAVISCASTRRVAAITDRDPSIDDNDARRQELRRADGNTLGGADAFEPLHRSSVALRRAAYAGTSFSECPRRVTGPRRNVLPRGSGTLRDLGVLLLTVFVLPLVNAGVPRRRPSRYATRGAIRFESSSSSWPGPPAHCSEIQRLLTELFKAEKARALPTAHVVCAEESYLNRLRQFRQTNSRPGSRPFKRTPSSKSCVRKGL